MIEEAYAKDNYETNLLVNQLKPISDIFNLDKTTIYIIDTKEKKLVITSKSTSTSFNMYQRSKIKKGMEE